MNRSSIPPAAGADTEASLPGWVPSVRLAAVLVLLAGVAYPAVTTLAGGWLFPERAGGSLIVVDGRTVGSSLVGQPYAASGRFHGRPSAAGHDPFALAGSNLAPSNPALRDRASADAAAIAAREGVDPASIPVDLVAASGSGIDPHVSPAAARLQVARVARERALGPGAVRALVDAHVEGPTLGVLGQPRVNVLELNLALERLAGESGTGSGTGSGS